MRTPLRLLPALLFGFVLVAGCNTPVATTLCNPACGAGTHCDPNSVTCVPDAETGDMSAATSPDIAMDCPVACVAPTPICSGHVCIACNVDADCPTGTVCHVANGLSSCVQGCDSDSRCNGGDGGAMSCCNSACTDTQTDPANCGACNTACNPENAVAQCTGGACGFTTCNPNFGDCNKVAADGCEANFHVDLNNCGGCAMACTVANGIAGCSDSCYIAACNFGYDDCDGTYANGCETSTLSDPKNCGGCGMACPPVANATISCNLNACQLTSCVPGFADCDHMAANGCESNIYTDANNCGGCGNACPQNLTCQNGGCTCPQCKIPNSKTACVNLVCTWVSCLQNYGDCNNNLADGCEASLIGDPKNCGACGTVCPQGTPYCVNGVCSLINTNVLIVGASQASWVTEVQAGLKATGAFQSVDVIQGNTTTPTVAAMMPYGAVLAFSDNAFADPATLGNNLADYYDAGGQVVIATFANASVAVTGRFGTVANGYMLITPGGQEEPNDSLGTINEPNTSLVIGVAKLTATAAYRSTGAVANGGVVVAQWASGKPLIVRGVIKGRNRADVNLYPPSVASRNDFWSGDGSVIMKNALLYR